mmetsp:Transcript_24863/g.30563  ORF Transcript_24863/g.30563 Transcript_24863/m.30563 type:complete len:220 (+) Transcript_24863:93-752(+)
MNVSRLCSTCNETKDEGHFSKSQKKRGRTARCKHCVVIDRSSDLTLRCSICKEYKDKIKTFSKKERKKGDDEARCTSCVSDIKLMLISRKLSDDDVNVDANANGQNAGNIKDQTCNKKRGLKYLKEMEEYIHFEKEREEKKLKSELIKVYGRQSRMYTFQPPGTIAHWIMIISHLLILRLGYYHHLNNWLALMISYFVIRRIHLMMANDIIGQRKDHSY